MCKIQTLQQFQFPAILVVTFHLILCVCSLKAPQHPSMYQDCHRSSCRPSCIRSPSRLLPWQLQPLPDTRGSSRALQAQVPRMQTARLLCHLRPGWSSHGPPYLHASPNPWAPEGPPSTCRKQCPPQQDNRLTKYEFFKIHYCVLERHKTKVPFKESRWPYLQHLWSTISSPIFLNKTILKSEKLLATFIFKLFITYQ